MYRAKKLKLNKSMKNPIKNAFDLTKNGITYENEKNNNNDNFSIYIIFKLYCFY